MAEPIRWIENSITKTWWDQLYSRRFRRSFALLIFVTVPGLIGLIVENALMVLLLPAFFVLALVMYNFLWAWRMGWRRRDPDTLVSRVGFHDRSVTFEKPSGDQFTVADDEVRYDPWYLNEDGFADLFLDDQKIVVLLSTELKCELAERWEEE